jgi:hypothetical protein
MGDRLMIKYDAPEFYRQDVAFLSVSGTNGVFHIASEGTRVAFYNGKSLSTHTDFRNAFPDGNLPEMSDDFEWSYNAWFAIYDDGEVVGEPEMSLTDAINYALALTYSGEE